jgi:hypothetical protein
LVGPFGLADHCRLHSSGFDGPAVLCLCVLFYEHGFCCEQERAFEDAVPLSLQGWWWQRYFSDVSVASGTEPRERSACECASRGSSPEESLLCCAGLARGRQLCWCHLLSLLGHSDDLFCACCSVPWQCTVAEVSTLILWHSCPFWPFCSVLQCTVLQRVSTL